MTLVEFLLARIAEDEAAALGRVRIGAPPGITFEVWESGTRRALAECAAKRRIVEREVGSRTKPTYRRLFVLQDLASVYADHPDYRDEWKP